MREEILEKKLRPMAAREVTAPTLCERWVGGQGMQISQNELLAEKALSDATYAAAQGLFTTEELVALVTRVGSFSMTCCTANAFQITPPNDAPAALKP